MSQRLILKNIIVFLLVLMWVYAASSKLMDFNLYKAQMYRQYLPTFLKDNLVYFLPPLELGVAIALSFESLAKAALYSSFIMLSAFTLYIALVLTKFMGKVPCSCGGIISHMGWTVHLFFNLFFMLINACGIFIFLRERRLSKTSE